MPRPISQGFGIRLFSGGRGTSVIMARSAWLAPMASPGDTGHGPDAWLFSQPSFCLAISTTRVMACSKELKLGNPFASWHSLQQYF